MPNLCVLAVEQRLSCVTATAKCGDHRRIVDQLSMICDASQCCDLQSVCLQGQSEHCKGRFVQPPQLVWLAMNVLLTLIKPKAMVALLEQVWPGLVDALLQECGRPSQHMWMIMGCLRTFIQVLGVQVYGHHHCVRCIVQKLNKALHALVCLTGTSRVQAFKQFTLQGALATLAVHQTHDIRDLCAFTQAPFRRCCHSLCCVFLRLAISMHLATQYFECFRKFAL